MTELIDSGSRTVFQGGAAREILDDKGRCDLLPLYIIAERTHDTVFAMIDNYIRYGNIDSLWSALDLYIVREDTTFWNTLLEVSKHYADGAKKYADRNWELGLPLHSFIDSGVRHYIKYRDEWDDEPHGRAFVWNMLGAIWTHKNHPDLIDLPFKEKKNEDNN